MKKIFAVFQSFLMTVVPALPLYAFVVIALFFLESWYDNIFFPTNLLIIVFCFPLFYMGFSGAASILGSFKVALGGFIGGETDSIELESVGSGYFRIKIITAEDKKVGKMILILLGGVLLSPFVIIAWIIQVGRIILSQSYCDKINAIFNESKKSILLFVSLALVGSIVPFANEGILRIQDSIYSVDKFEFEFVDFSYNGEEWAGFNNVKYSYTLKYAFQNNGKKLGSISGDIIIENQEGVKFVLEDRWLSVYGQTSQKDFEKHFVEYYFYVLDDKTEINSMLKSDNADIKISLVIYEANWDKGMGNGTRDYEDGQQIVIKDFGVLDVQQPQLPNDGANGNQDENTNELNYQQAISLYNNGEYEKALAIFQGLGNYKQSADYISNCEDKLFYVQMENDLHNVAGSVAVLPDNYQLSGSYSSNYYIYYKYDYFMGFSADFSCDQNEMQSCLNSFSTKLINNGYSCLSEGVYQKENTIILLSYFEGDNYFTYQAFKTE